MIAKSMQTLLGGVGFQCILISLVACFMGLVHDKRLKLRIIE